MNTPASQLLGILKFLSIDDGLATAGQPTADQFRLLREGGFEVVINLALHSSDNALANEGSIVTALGMAYVHIPVKFDAPTADDFRAFCGVMKVFEGKRVFVHCAANKRVSAFVFLYRVLCKGTDLQQAARDLRAVWEPDPVWRGLINQQLKNGSETQACRAR